jgi:DivIVA domain-containing protein
VLTPEDIHNVNFKKPPIGQRGYDEGEVDAFLELCEAELTQAHAEIARLSSGPATQPQQAIGIPAKPVPQAVREPEQPSRILELAQEVADKYVAEAKQKADADIKAMQDGAVQRAADAYHEALAGYHKRALAQIEGEK